MIITTNPTNPIMFILFFSYGDGSGFFFKGESILLCSINEAGKNVAAWRAWRNSPESKVNTTCEYYLELRVIDELPNLVKRQNMFTNTGN